MLQEAIGMRTGCMHYARVGEYGVNNVVGLRQLVRIYL